MSLNPRAIALHGIGFGALLIAVQGFAPATVEQVQQATPGYTASADDALRFAVPDELRVAVSSGAVLTAYTGGTREAETAVAAYSASSQGPQEATGGSTWVAYSDGQQAAEAEPDSYIARSTGT